MAKLTYKDAGVNLDKYNDADGAAAPTAARGPIPPRAAAGRRVCRAVPTRFCQPAFRPAVQGSGAGVLHRRRGHQAQGGHADGRPQHGGHRPGGHERQRRPVLRGRAAVLPRLRGHAQGRSAAAGARSWKGSPPAACRATAPCWAAKRRSCPTCTPRATTIWPAFAWAWSSGAG